MSLFTAANVVSQTSLRSQVLLFLDKMIQTATITLARGRKSSDLGWPLCTGNIKQPRPRKRGSAAQHWTTAGPTFTRCASNGPMLGALFPCVWQKQVASREPKIRLVSRHGVVHGRTIGRMFLALSLSRSDRERNDRGMGIPSPYSPRSLYFMARLRPPTSRIKQLCIFQLGIFTNTDEGA